MKELLKEDLLIIRDPEYGRKVLLFDIETAPNLSYIWGRYEQNTLAVKQHWYILCFAHKWLGEKQTYVKSLPDFKTYKKDPTNDELLVTELWKLFNQADVIVGHNGDSFDIKKTNARFLKHGLEPPSPYKTIDTLKLAKKHFKLDSNKLDDLGEFFKIGRKIQTGGFDLWLGCIAGDPKAWATMTAYNKQDVILLEKIYYKLRGWATNGAYLNIILGNKLACRYCGSDHLTKKGLGGSELTLYQRFKCLNCGANLRQPVSKKDEKPLR
jgi:hypothetical protein